MHGSVRMPNLLGGVNPTQIRSIQRAIYEHRSMRLNTISSRAKSPEHHERTEEHQAVFLGYMYNCNAPRNCGDNAPLAMA